MEPVRQWGVRHDRGSGRTERDEQFHVFVVERRSQLVRTATLLTGGDPHLAEDLVQSVLTKLYVAWPAFRRAANPEGYVRRTLVNALTDEHRRIWRRRERSMAQVPDRAVTDAATGGDGDAVRQVVQALPPRMRAAVVFRYFYDLGIAETADALGCSEGTVKSQTAKALDRLRVALGQQRAPIGSSLVTSHGVTS
jgi:RNA polymerase sigma-70 factor (sigma-E family)